MKGVKRKESKWEGRGELRSSAICRKENRAQWGRVKEREGPETEKGGEGGGGGGSTHLRSAGAILLRPGRGDWPSTAEAD